MLLNKPRGNKFVIRNLFLQVFHMLPKEMCQLCSLLPGADKLAFSVFWEITPQAEIVRHYFKRSIINSCAQLAYQHAQVNLY
jgi:DIS3-like exonuclease 2